MKRPRGVIPSWISPGRYEFARGFRISQVLPPGGDKPRPCDITETSACPRAAKGVGPYGVNGTLSYNSELRTPNYPKNVIPLGTTSRRAPGSRRISNFVSGMGSPSTLPTSCPPQRMEMGSAVRKWVMYWGS